MSNNLATVQQMYAAFGQGDVPTVLSLMPNDVVLINAADPSKTPISGEFKGKEGAVQYFTILGTTVQTTNFVASNFREADNEVVNDILHEGVVVATGKPFSSQLTFTWTFNDKGEPIHWVGSGDFESLYAASVN